MPKINKMRWIVAAAFGSLSLSAGAATTYTWDLTTGSGTPNTRTYTSNSGGQSLTVRALYSANTSDGTGALKSNESSSSTKAGLASYGTSGLGVVNPVDCTGTGCVETTSPYHATDNMGNADDFMLLDFGQVLAPQSFQIGWKGSDSDMDFFIGPANATAVNFTNANGTSNGTTIASLLAAGWTKVNFQDVPDCDPTQSACPTQFSGGTGYSTSLKGRYMIVAGQLNGSNDAFKFSQITMNLPSGGSSPLPGTLALLGVGAFGMAWTRKRQAKAA